tara:strand:- start:16012 stop:16911 length:900 start_codon:yes stop_codon:yes gene_type:complete
MNTLYKYMPFRQEFFENFLVRCSQRAALNDPFEMLPGVDYMVALEFDALGRPSGRFGNTREEVRQYFQKDLSAGVRAHVALTQDTSDLGIISFTETRDNLLMWSHYADQHRGMVVEYDLHHEFFTKLNGESERLARVFYRKQRSKDLYPDSISAELVDLYGILFEKSDEWIYEKEFRVSRKLIKADLIAVTQKFWNENPHGLFTHTDITPEVISGPNWLNLTGLIAYPAQGLLDSADAFFFFKIPPNAIKSVSCGALMPDSAVKLIKAKAVEHDFICQKAKIHDDDYCLQFETLTSNKG